MFVGTYSQKGKYDVTVYDPAFIDPYGRGIYKLNGETDKPIKFKQPDVSVAAEFGIDLDEWLQKQPRTDKDAKEGENAPITKIFGLPATDNSTPAKEYVYRIVEEPWSWSYVTGASTPTTTDLLEVNPFIFTNSKKANIDNKVKNGESKTFNEFLPGNTEGSYVDSKPRTTTTTTTP